MCLTTWVSSTSPGVFFFLFFPLDSAIRMYRALTEQFPIYRQTMMITTSQKGMSLEMLLLLLRPSLWILCILVAARNRVNTWTRTASFSLLSYPLRVSSSRWSLYWEVWFCQSQFPQNSLFQSHLFLWELNQGVFTLLLVKRHCL